MHAGDVALQGVTFHGSILTQLTAVQLLTRLSQHVNTQLAFAGKVVFAGGTLQAGVGKMETHVLNQVRTRLKAAPAFCTYVSAKHVLCALYHVIYNTATHRHRYSGCITPALIRSILQHLQVLTSSIN